MVQKGCGHMTKAEKRVNDRIAALRQERGIYLSNDARFWDGWRTYGDAWAMAYLDAL